MKPLRRGMREYSAFHSMTFQQQLHNSPTNNFLQCISSLVLSCRQDYHWTRLPDAYTSFEALLPLFGQNDVVALIAIVFCPGSTLHLPLIYVHSSDLIYFQARNCLPFLPSPLLAVHFFQNPWTSSHTLQNSRSVAMLLKSSFYKFFHVHAENVVVV